MKKYIAPSILFLVVVLGLIVYVQKSKATPAPTNTESEIVSDSSSDGSGSEQSPQPPAKDPAWDTLTAYLAGLKAHDIEGVKKLSYQQSDACKNKATEADCFKLMDSAYSIGSQLKQSSYVLRAEDRKQLILTTKTEKDSMGTTTVGLVRGHVVFTKTPLGAYQVLSFDLGKGLYRTSTSTSVEEVYKNLETAVIDTDKDGLFDDEEQCIGDFAFPGCVKTDPQKNDTDGDGWWDGVEIFFKK